MQPAAPPRRVTIVDVAAHARVSTTAVSKVIRNAYGVSPSMRTKVTAAIAELGYRPSTGARGMRGQTYTIGLMLPDLRNPFFPEIIDGFVERLADTQYEVLLGTSFCGQEAETRVTEAMIDRGMDGVVLVAPTAAQTQLNRTAGILPIVVIGRHARSAVHDTVVDDDTAGAGLVVNHLADLGHRRIAHIAHQEKDAVRSAAMPNAIRAEGYQQAMRARGLADEIDVVSTSYTEQGGYLGAPQLLGRRHPPTAIFAGADIAAMGVLQAVAEAGLSVPGEISVVGYDNTTYAALGPISLTSVDQAGRQIGSEAARVLLERIADRKKSSVFISTSPTLVVRRTTGPCPSEPHPRHNP
jgi:LacI family transcriptional regulator